MIYNQIDNNKNKWIVLIHCVCGNEEIFSKQIQKLNELYNIAIVRLAGHDIFSKENEATFDYVVEEVHKFAALKKQKIDVMGVSLGAMIATEYILKYPNEVENAYLIGNIYGFSIPLFKMLYFILLKINKILPRPFYMYFITKAILPGKKQNDQRKKLYSSSKKMDKTFLYLWMQEMGEFICKGKERFNFTLDSKVNIHLIYGVQDFIFLNWVKKYIKNSKRDILTVVKDSAHLCNMDAPEIINMIVEGDNCEKIGHN